MNIQTIDFNDQFTINEAVALLNSHVVKEEHQHMECPPLELIGFVAGVITLNDEVEVIVKFFDGIVQLTKSAFQEKVVLIEMP